MLVGLGLMLLMIFRPQGILGDKRGGGRQCPPLTPGSPRSPSTASTGSPPEPGVAKPDPILVADGVRRRFGGLTAVDVDHLEVQRGAITALIGPNGAGKTTFFNLLTGFDKPDTGTLDLRRRGPQPACPAHKVARHGMVRTFQLTKSLAAAVGAREHEARRHRPARREVLRARWSARCGGPRRREHRGAGRRAARAVQARPHARRVRRLAVGRPAQAARDGPGADGRARRWSCSTSRWPA